MLYADRIKNVLSPAEDRIFKKLNTPQKVQTFLESFPINFEENGETNLSPRRVLQVNKAHCFEGAVFAAAALAYHGHKPLLMDFATAYDDEDHTVALFSAKGGSASGGKTSKFWGAVSKTNHTILRYRDPVYTSPRELAMSYFHEYFMLDGRKSLRAYSHPFNLSRYPLEKWITTEEPLDWLMKDLSRTRYYDIAPAYVIRTLRKASSIELKALKLTEWRLSKGGKRA